MLTVFAKSWILLITVFIAIQTLALAWSAESLRLGYSGATATQLAATLAVEQKLFEFYGLNVELIQSAGTTMIRALDSSSLDVAVVGGGQALSAYMNGADVRIISGLVNTIPFQLWAKPQISQVKDLKGKLIASSPPGTSLNLGTNIFLMRAGLDPRRDVKLIAFGRIQLIARALLGGVVDAALLSPPDTIEARKSGFRMVMDLARERIPCPFTSVVTTKAVLEKSPTALERFLKGIFHGIKLVSSNPDMAKKAISRNMRLTDREAIDEVYDRIVAAYDHVPVVPKEAIETAVKLSPGLPNRNPFGVLDMGLLEKIDKQGFFRSL